MRNIQVYLTLSVILFTGCSLLQKPEKQNRNLQDRTFYKNSEYQIIPFESEIINETNKVVKYGLKDVTGKIIIEPKYTMIFKVYNSSFFCIWDEIQKKLVILDLEENFVLSPLLFDNGPDYFEDGVARYIENEKVGYFNETMKKVIPARFDFAFPFYDNYAIVCNGCQRIDSDEYEKIEGGKWGVIDKTGDIVVPLQYEKIRRNEKNEYFEGRKNGIWIKLENEKILELL